MATKSPDLTALYSKRVGKVVKYKPNQTTLIKYTNKTPKKSKNR